ncbi:MAG: hypothetical protein Q9219_006952 [cf. Caloplaca sp. 3 TL-2023]
MVSTIPCLKPFVAGLNTGYGAFDTEHVATRAYGSYGSNGYAQRQRSTKQSNNRHSKSVFDSKKGSSGFHGKGVSKGRTTVDDSGHHGPPREAATAVRELENRSPAGQVEERDGGKVVTQISSPTPDGNSIGSNESRQMIIRKDVAWAVEYSDV